MPPYDIQERAFDFASAIVRFCCRLGAAHPVARHIGWQLLDSGTSVGANLEEADAAQTKPDFRAKISIARKECREAHYWLRLIAIADLRFVNEQAPLLAESNELISILTTIKKNSETSDERGEEPDV